MASITVKQIDDFSSFFVFVRPYVRRNFLNFSFLRVSEMFSCQISEIFWKNGIFELTKFSWKSLEKSSEI